MSLEKLNSFNNLFNYLFIEVVNLKLERESNFNNKNDTSKVNIELTNIIKKNSEKNSKNFSIFTPEKNDLTKLNNRDLNELERDNKKIIRNYAKRIINDVSNKQNYNHQKNFKEIFFNNIICIEAYLKLFSDMEILKMILFNFSNHNIFNEITNFHLINQQFLSEELIKSKENFHNNDIDNHNDLHDNHTHPQHEFKVSYDEYILKKLKDHFEFLK